MTDIAIRTIFAGYVLSILLCTIVMTSLWWENKKRSPEIVFWLADYILQFIALLLITFRALLPDFFTIVVANFFIVGGTIVLFTGLCRYVEKESRQLHNYVMLAVFTLACLYFTYVYPDIELRTVNQSIALIYICAQCSWLMLRRVDAGLLPATKATGIVFAALCLVSIVQIVVNLTIPKTHNIFVSGFFGVVAVFMYQILFVALTFTLFLLVSRRLSTDLESELFQRRQAEWALKERFKELNCLYGIAALIEAPGISLDEILKKAVMLLPPAWQFPEISEARITLNGQISQTEHFSETPWMQAHKIIVNGKPIGQVEVCYLEERPINDEGPFLIEERQLIKAVAERLGRVIESKMAEEQIRHNQTRLMSLLNIMQHRAKTTQEFLDYALDEVIKLTESKIGYIYFYHEDRHEFVLNTWSKDVMNECKIANPQTCYELEKTGIWGEAVRQRKPIIINDYRADHPLKKGYPEGHAPLTNFMTVPVFNEDQIVAVVGIANKVGNYDETDVLQLTLFMDAVWKSVNVITAEETLRESGERIRAITNAANEAITMMDNNGNISYWNPAAQRILGYTREEAIGKNLHELIAPERFRSAHLATFSEFQKTGQGNAIGKTLELAARRKDGQEIDIALSLSAVKIKGAWHSVGIIQDITERKKAEEQIKHLATHDLLTDLPSMRLARDRLSLALDMARRYKKAVALMFVDLDGFKDVNDSFGHDAGDYVLKQVAKRLLSCVRETDTVARFGGDEFLIIATEINTPENAAQIAEKVIQLVSEPVIFNGQRAIIGTSIGIALFPDHGEDMDQLIRQADKAMYSVKNAGKNGFSFVNSTIK